MRPGGSSGAHEALQQSELGAVYSRSRLHKRLSIPELFMA